MADVPARYGPWQTVYGLFRRWQRNGVWAHASLSRYKRTPRARCVGGLFNGWFVQGC